MYYAFCSLVHLHGSKQLCLIRSPEELFKHFNDQVVYRLLRAYERNCIQCQSMVDAALKKALEDGQEKAALLTKV